MRSIIGSLLIILFTGCEKAHVPKPLGYNRLNLPEHSYTDSPDSLPYRFQYSIHARLLPDTSSIRDRFWIELHYDDLKATIHLTYKELQHNEELLREYLGDSYALTAKHQIKAYSIEETILETKKGITAIIADIDGEVPSQLQFTITDSTENFLRGALYFYARVNNDSLAPAIDYVKKDAMHFIHSLEWR